MWKEKSDSRPLVQGAHKEERSVVDLLSNGTVMGSGESESVQKLNDGMVVLRVTT